MSTTIPELLSLAEELIASRSEVGLRTSASRSFYAAYHRCRILQSHIASASRNRDPVGMHERLIRDLLRFPGVPTSAEKQAKAIGKLLKDARDLRVDADYRIDQDFSEASARTAHSICRQVDSQAILLAQELQK